MNPEDILQGGGFETQEPKDVLGGGEFSIEGEAPTAVAEKPKSLFGKYAEGFNDFSTGFAKGAVSTIATVPRNINKIVGAATDLKQMNSATDKVNKINAINDRLLVQLKQAPMGSEEHDKLTKLIKSNVDAVTNIQKNSQMDSDIINAHTEGFEERAKDLTKAEGGAEEAGFLTEKIAEFFIPGGATKTAVGKINAAHIPETLKFLARIGVKTAAPTTVALAQQGEPNKEVAKVAAVSAVFSTAEEAISVAAKTPAGKQFVKWLTEKIPGRKLNSIIKPQTKDFNFGKNPGQSVVEEGITANTRGELLSKIGQKKSEIGAQIDDVLRASTEQVDDTAKATIDKMVDTFSKGIGKTEPSKEAFANVIKDGVQQLKEQGLDDIANKVAQIDTAKVRTFEQLRSSLIDAASPGHLDVSKAILEPIKEAQKSAIRSGDKALYTRLVDLEEGLTKNFGDDFAVIGNKALDNLTPKQAQQLKIQIGGDTRWTGQAFDGDVNKVRVSVYRKLDDLIDEAVSGISELNQRYGGLLTAEKALERTNNARQRLVELGLRSTGVGSLVGAGSLAKGDSGPEAFLKGALGAGLFSALGSTPVKTRMAQFYSGLTPENATKFIDIVKNVYLGAKASKQNNNNGDDSE